ncbi:hypothetical protein, partial [Pseudomonas putida]
MDFHDADTAFWQGLVLDRGIFPEFKAWQHESYREPVLSLAACAGLFAGEPAGGIDNPVGAGSPAKR